MFFGSQMLKSPAMKRPRLWGWAGTQTASLGRTPWELATAGDKKSQIIQKHWVEAIIPTVSELSSICTVFHTPICTVRPQKDPWGPREVTASLYGRRPSYSYNYLRKTVFFRLSDAQMGYGASAVGIGDGRG